MTFAMSTEGDSVKSALSEANDKNATDNHTDDSSQDSVNAKETPADKPVQNNVNSEAKVEKPKNESTEAESGAESDASKKDEEMEVDAKNEEKPKENNENAEDGDEVKKEEMETKSEEDEEADEKDEKDSKTEEKPVKEAKKAKPSKEKDEKASNASEKDEEEDEVEDEEEEEEEDEEDEEGEKKGKKSKKGVPLLDQPLETSGKRERKNVQRFEEEAKAKDPPKVEFEEGSGTALGDIPRIDANLNRIKADDLKLLHKLLFKMQGSKQLFKKNIRKFNGFAFEKESDDYKKKVESIKKNEMKSLKAICDTLDLAKAGSKDDVVERIMEFLMEPKDSGKPLAGSGRPKRASAVRANNRGYSSHDDYSSDERQASRARRDKGKRANLKDDTSSDEEFKPGDASDASDEKPRAVSKRKRGRTKKGSSDEDEASLSGGSSDESDDAPKSKRRKSITKTNSKAKAKTPSRRGRPSKAAATPRSTTKRGRKPKDATSDEEEEEDEKMNEDSSSEDEPLAKKKAKTNEPPTDEEIKTFIKDVLEGANLEEITMKTVCQRVYDNYPDFDLTARKNFIKSTVKSLIST